MKVVIANHDVALFGERRKGRIVGLKAGAEDKRVGVMRGPVAGQYAVLADLGDGLDLVDEQRGDAHLRQVAGQGVQRSHEVGAAQ